MRLSVSLGLLSLFLAAYSTAAVSDPVDELCDPLKAEGVTKGLYGLCVAFHSSGGDRDKIREKYEDRMGPDDPPLPMEGECACWSAEMLASDVAIQLEREEADTANPARCIVNESPTAYVVTLVLEESSYQAALLYDLPANSSCGYSGAGQFAGDTIGQCIDDLVVIAAAQLEIACGTY